MYVRTAAQSLRFDRYIDQGLRRPFRSPHAGCPRFGTSLFYGIPLPLPFPTLFAEGGSCAYASLHFLLKFLESVRTVPFVGARRGFCYATSQVHKN